MNVLIVEDDRDTAELERRSLERAGFGVTLTSTISDAKRLLQQESFQTVLLDYQLPDGDPWEIVEIARGLIPRVPVVLVTGHGNERIVATAMQRGVADYIRKSDSFWDQLATTVHRVAKLARAEAELHRSDALLQLIANHASDVILTLDRAGRIRFISPACKRLLAYEPADLIGASLLDLIHPIDRDGVRFLDDPRPLISEQCNVFRCFRKDGGFIWIEASVRHIENGDLDGEAELVAVLRDITERRDAELALRESEERFRGAFETASHGMALVSMEGRWLKVNKALCNIVGYAEDELLAIDFQSITAPEDLGIGLDMLRRVTSGELSSFEMEKRYRHKQGHVVWVLLSASLIRDEHGKPVHFVSQIIDVTARRQAEERLKLSEEQFRGAFETAAHGMALVSTEGRWLKVNKAVCDIVGYSAEELLATDFQNITHPDDLDADLEFVRQLLAGEIPTYQMEKRYFHKEGHVVWILLSVSLVRDADGKPVHFVSQIIDVTETHRVGEALRAAKDEAENANRAKSDFLATMSHEIRTPLNGVLGLSSLLLDTPLSPEQKYRVQMIESAGKSLIAIVNDVLDVSKIEAGKLELERIALCPREIAQEAIAILRSQTDLKNLELRIELAQDLPAWIEGDPTRLRQVLLNFLSNAIKFTDRGQITLAMRREADGDGQRLYCEVSDTGIGIAADKQHLLFQDFSQIGRSQKSQMGSSGLGLSICRRLVESMGGAIGMRSTAGRGSTFWFALPIRDMQPPASEAVPVNGRGKNSVRILVAEDLLLNQIVVEGILRGAGHSVTVVDNGTRALEALRTHKFDVILMDMEMPVMDGLAATRLIRTLDETVRGIPIIGLTANAFEKERAECLAAGMNEHLSKPVNREQLLRTIARWSGHAVDEAHEILRESISDPIISDVCLKELEEHLGRDHVAALIELFRVSLEEIITTVTSSRNRAHIGKAAHSLISLAGNLGCAELVARSRELVMASRTEGTDIEHLVAETATAAHRARAAIDRRYPRS